jgi:hypothetical protein
VQSLNKISFKFHAKYLHQNNHVENIKLANVFAISATFAEYYNIISYT